MDLADRIQDLGELELATLVSLIAGQHCVVHTDTIDSLDRAHQQLEGVCFVSI